jgi:hypothetical protein
MAMRKITIITTLMLASTALFISCGKDDEPAPAAPAAPPAPTSTPTPCSGIVKGYATPVGTQTYFSVNWIIAYPVTASAPATVNALTLSLSAGTATSIRVAVYSNNSSTQFPGSLLCQVGPRLSEQNSMMTINIPPIGVVAGEVYWIAYQVAPTDLPSYTVNTGRRAGIVYYWNDFPLAAPSGTIWTDMQAVAYLNACP